jgi:hypothetical protein
MHITIGTPASLALRMNVAFAAGPHEEGNVKIVSQPAHSVKPAGTRILVNPAGLYATRPIQRQTRLPDGGSRLVSTEPFGRVKSLSIGTLPQTAPQAPLVDGEPIREHVFCDFVPQTCPIRE